MFRSGLLIVVAGFLVSVANVSAALIPVTPGQNAITIPVVGSGNYSATNIFSTAMDTEIVYRWDGVSGSWVVFTHFEGVGWDPIAPIFNVGEGIFYYAIAAQTFVANFHGNLVPEIASPRYAPAPPPLVQNRYYFQGSPTGMSATYENVFGGPPNNETALFRFVPGGTDINPSGPHYTRYYYKDGVWTPQTPVLNPLEPAFVVFPYLSVKYTVTTTNPITINLSWPRGTLEEANRPTGMWNTVTTIGNAHAVVPSAATNQARYYRIKE